MADENALSILAREDIDDWEQLRRSTTGPIDLRYAHISSVTLSGIDLSGCDFDDSYFDDCDLRGSDFSSAFLRSAKFRKCMLSDALFHRASLESAVFDRCELDGTDFKGSYGLELGAIETSYYDETTKFPLNIGDPDEWIDDDEEEEAEDVLSEAPPDTLNQDKSSIELEDKKIHRTAAIPEIPNRVIAPLETGWKKDRLYVERFESDSSLRSQIEGQMIKELRRDLDGLCRLLIGTNFDQRIVEDIQLNLKKFPRTAQDFRRKTVSIWYAFRPLFEYMNITKGQHSDYIEAKIISFELNLRDALLTYNDFRQYDAASQAVKTTNRFDYTQFCSAQADFARALSKQPDIIDESVVAGMEHIVDIQSRQYIPENRKSVLYGAASTIANIISRIFLRAVREIADGAAEGIKDSTKKLVSTTIAAGGGAVLIWLLSSGLESFVWLKHAWNFIKSFYNF